MYLQIDRLFGEFPRTPVSCYSIHFLKLYIFVRNAHIYIYIPTNTRTPIDLRQWRERRPYMDLCYNVNSENNLSEKPQKLFFPYSFLFYRCIVNPKLPRYLWKLQIVAKHRYFDRIINVSKYTIEVLKNITILDYYQEISIQLYLQPSIYYFKGCQDELYVFVIKQRYFV